MFNFDGGFLNGLLDLMIPSRRIHAERMRTLQLEKMNAEIIRTKLENAGKFLEILEQHFPTMSAKDRERLFLEFEYKGNILEKYDKY
jgi:hypothetical protein